MIAEISAALASAKASFEMTKALLQISTDVKVQQAVIELQQSILGLQSEVMAVHGKMEELSRVKDEVEKKLEDKVRWDEEEKRYTLTELAPGILVYALKEGQKGSEPAHYLCPNCFQKKEKSILQKPSPNHRNYKCHRCAFEMIPVPRPPQPPRAIRMGGHDSYGGF